MPQSILYVCQNSMVSDDSMGRKATNQPAKNNTENMFFVVDVLLIVLIYFAVNFYCLNSNKNNGIVHFFVSYLNITYI